jgi:hypothetical protein
MTAGSPAATTGAFMATDDLHAHQEMWHNFTRLLGYSATAILATLAGMAMFLL